MRRGGFSPYGPSKAALESETIIWPQELAGTGVTVNALLPGGPTRTGMVPDIISDEVRSRLLNPEIVAPPLLWLISKNADPITGMRIVANRWKADLSVRKQRRRPSNQPDVDAEIEPGVTAGVKFR